MTTTIVLMVIGAGAGAVNIRYLLLGKGIRALSIIGVVFGVISVVSGALSLVLR